MGKRFRTFGRNCSPGLSGKRSDYPDTKIEGNFSEKTLRIFLFRRSSNFYGIVAIFFELVVERAFAVSRETFQKKNTLFSGKKFLKLFLKLQRKLSEFLDMRAQIWLWELLFRCPKERFVSFAQKKV